MAQLTKTKQIVNLRKDDLLTVKETAEEMGVHVQTVHKWIRERETINFINLNEGSGHKHGFFVIARGDLELFKEGYRYKKRNFRRRSDDNGKRTQ